MNPNLRLPFKRYEIGKVFRDGPVKTGRLREFTQCDVDIAGVKSTLAEAEMMAMAFDAFDQLGLDIFIAYNNRKLLTGVLECIGLTKNLVNEAVISLDKVEKIGEKGVREELAVKGINLDLIGKIFSTFKEGKKPGDYASFSSHAPVREGIAELNELEDYLSALQLQGKTVFNPLLARGLEIYTEQYTKYSCPAKQLLPASVAADYDRIIGGFLNNGVNTAAGISFGLDVIYTALSMENEQYGSQAAVDFSHSLGGEKNFADCAEFAKSRPASRWKCRKTAEIFGLCQQRAYTLCSYSWRE